VLCFAGLQSITAETIITAQDYAVDSDVVLESAVKEIKSIPQDTINVIGDGLKFVSDETVTAAKGVAAVFKTDPVEKTEKAGLIEIANAWSSANDILFRSYKVSAEVGSELAQGTEGGTVDVSGYFTGMKFADGTSAYYRPEFKKLFVRQTLENVLAIEDVLAEKSNATRKLMGKQVEIEAKFVEVNQSTLNELGFEWNFQGKGGVGDSAHIFDNLTLPGGQDIMVAGLRAASTALGTDASTGSFL
jgi:type II secretory pathway component GspD/PulD (secretin)